MSDSLKNEAVYDQDRIERHIHAERTRTGLSRRDVVQLLAASVAVAFSPRRSFWGTDLSVMLSRSTCTYSQAVTLFTEEMGYSKGDQEWILGRGLAECLPWPIK